MKLKDLTVTHLWCSNMFISLFLIELAEVLIFFYWFWIWLVDILVFLKTSVNLALLVLMRLVLKVRILSKLFEKWVLIFLTVQLKRLDDWCLFFNKKCLGSWNLCYIGLIDVAKRKFCSVNVFEKVLVNWCRALWCKKCVWVSNVCFLCLFYVCKSMCCNSTVNEKFLVSWCRLLWVEVWLGVCTGCFIGLLYVGKSTFCGSNVYEKLFVIWCLVLWPQSLGFLLLDDGGVGDLGSSSGSKFISV